MPVAPTLSPQNIRPQLPDAIQTHFTHDAGTAQAGALRAPASHPQGLSSVLSGRRQSRSNRIFSTESLLSRHSESPPSEHVVRVKGKDKSLGRKDVSLAEELGERSSGHRANRVSFGSHPVTLLIRWED